MKFLALGLRLIGGLSLLASETTDGAAPPPMLSFTATPTSTTVGGQVQLNWAATNVKRCTASDAWSGSRTTVGSAYVGPLTATSTFTLRCSGQGSITRSVQVNVVTAPPTTPAVSLSASPAIVAYDGSSTLTWASTSVSTCTASGGWSGIKSTAGTIAVGPLKQDTTYSLSCSGTNGSAVAMTAVSVRSAQLFWTAPSRYSDGSALAVAGYRIYYGAQSKSYNQSVAINGSATQWLLPLSAGTWFFAVTAVDATGAESALSNEASKTIN